MKGRAVTLPAALGWALFPVVAVEIVVTYARVPPAQLYHVSGTGLAAGFGRALVFLNFPTALASLPLIALAANRLRRSLLGVATALVAAGLCAVVFWPGVVDQADLDAKAVNALPATGVGLAVVLALAARLFAAPARIDFPIAALLVLLLVIALPWIAADLGLFLDAVPVFGSVFLTGDVVGGHPAVHHGHHHGMDGVLLVVAALAMIPALRRVHTAPLAAAAAAYLGLQVAYGLANIANDAWLEQVVKRGWTDVEIPNILRPAVSLPWFGIALAAPLFAAVLRRRAARWESLDNVLCAPGFGPRSRKRTAQRRLGSLRKRRRLQRP